MATRNLKISSPDSGIVCEKSQLILTAARSMVGAKSLFLKGLNSTFTVDQHHSNSGAYCNVSTIVHNPIP